MKNILKIKFKFSVYSHRGSVLKMKSGRNEKKKKNENVYLKEEKNIYAKMLEIMEMEISTLDVYII